MLGFYETSNAVSRSRSIAGTHLVESLLHRIHPCIVVSWDSFGHAWVVSIDLRSRSLSAETIDSIVGWRRSPPSSALPSTSSSTPPLAVGATIMLSPALLPLHSGLASTLRASRIAIAPSESAGPGTAASTSRSLVGRRGATSTRATRWFRHWAIASWIRHVSERPECWCS